MPFNITNPKHLASLTLIFKIQITSTVNCVIFDVNPPAHSSNLLLSVWSSHRRVLRWVVAERGAVCRAGGGGSNASCCCRGQRSHIRSFLFFFINAQPSLFLLAAASLATIVALSRPGAPQPWLLQWLQELLNNQQPTVVGSSFPSQLKKTLTYNPSHLLLKCQPKTIMVVTYETNYKSVKNCKSEKSRESIIGF